MALIPTGGNDPSGTGFNHIPGDIIPYNGNDPSGPGYWRVAPPPALRHRVDPAPQTNWLNQPQTNALGPRYGPPPGPPYPRASQAAYVQAPSSQESISLSPAFMDQFQRCFMPRVKVTNLRLGETATKVVEDVKREGMLIHSYLDIEGQAGQTYDVMAFFCDSSKENLVGNDGVCESGGKKWVNTQKRISPKYDDSVWENFSLFMPYDQLHLGKGRHECYLYIRILLRYFSLESYNYNYRKVYESDWFSFTYHNPRWFGSEHHSR